MLPTPSLPPSPTPKVHGFSLRESYDKVDNYSRNHEYHAGYLLPAWFRYMGLKLFIIFHA